MEMADLPGNRTKEMRLILFRSKSVCVGTALSLEATCEKYPETDAGAGEFLCQGLSTSASL